MTTGCTPACWTPVYCPSCGGELPPRGRSVPLEMYMPDCCDRARMDSAVNPRHMWRQDEDDDPAPDDDGDLPPDGPAFDVAEVKERILARLRETGEYPPP